MLKVNKASLVIEISDYWRANLISSSWLGNATLKAEYTKSVLKSWNSRGGTISLRSPLPQSGEFLWYCVAHRTSYVSLAPREASPVLVTVVAFWHYTVIRGQHLSPSIAFTAVSIYVTYICNLWDWTWLYLDDSWAYSMNWSLLWMHSLRPSSTCFRYVVLFTTWV